MSLSTQEESIKVLVRIRPNSFNDSYINIVDNTIYLNPNGKRYEYDYVELENSTQEDIFSKCIDVFQSFLDGYNGTIFAYGQTSSGKTYTMTGVTDASGSIEHLGIIPQGLKYIFNRISEQQQQSDNDLEYLVKCTYIEIYNEQVYDLLDNGQPRLSVRTNIKHEVYVESVTEVILQCPRDAEKILRKGLSNRHVGSTMMNRQSSRSHAVLSIILESKVSQNGVDNIRRSSLHLVDLAGCERQKDTKSVGKRLKEAASINKSLMMLGNAMRELSKSRRHAKRHVKYRDSKLTLILKDALGGNSKTLLVACIHPSKEFVKDTLRTLNFANNTRSIKNRAQVNVNTHGNVDSLTREVARLRHELDKGALFPLVTHKDVSSDSVWKTKFIAAMVLQSCVLLDQQKVHVEARDLACRCLELESTNKNLVNKHYDQLQDHQEPSAVSSSLSVDQLNSELRQLKNELEKAKLMANISHTTLANNVYADYNKLAIEESSKFKALQRYPPDLIKLQQDLSKANLTIDSLREHEAKLRGKHAEEKSELERELVQWRSKYMAGEEYVSIFNRKLTGFINNTMVAANNEQNNHHAIYLDGCSPRNLRRCSKIFGLNNNSSNNNTGMQVDNSSRLAFNVVNREEIEDYMRLQEENKQLQKKFNQLQQDYDKMAEFQSKYEELRQDFEIKEMRVREDAVTIKQLEKEGMKMVAAKDKKIEQMYDKMCEYEASIESLETELGGVQEQLDMLREENVCLQSAVTRNEHSQSLNEPTDHHCHGEEEQVEKLKLELSEARLEVESVLDKWRQAIQTNQKHKYELETAKLQLHEKHDEICSLEVDISSMKQINDALHTRQLDLTQQHANEVRQLTNEHRLAMENIQYESARWKLKWETVQAELDERKRRHDQSMNESFKRFMSMEEEARRGNYDNYVVLIPKLLQYIDKLNERVSVANNQCNVFIEWLQSTLTRYEISYESYMENNLESVSSLIDNFRLNLVKSEMQISQFQQKAQKDAEQMRVLEVMLEKEKHRGRRLLKVLVISVCAVAILCCLWPL